MTIANFPYRVRAEITDEVSLPSIVLTMGDGYKYRYPDGLNIPKTIWNIECPLDDRNAETNLEAFLERVGNDVPFMWQSPRDFQPRYYFIVGKVGGRYRVGGGAKKDFFVRSMQFEDANIVVIPTSGIFLLRVETTRFYDVYGSAIVCSPIFIGSGRFGSSVRFGSLDSITIPLRATPQLIPPTGDWTIDFWFTSKGDSNYGATFSLNNNQDRPLLIFRDNQMKLKITYGAGLQTIISAGDPSYTNFDYYGFQRKGEFLSAWKNGVMISSAPFDPAIVIDTPTTDSVIGSRSYFYANTGNYEEFRISHVAQNLAIVPTAQFII